MLTGLGGTAGGGSQYRANRTLEANTSEGFAALRKNLHKGSDTDKKQLKVAEKSEGHLKEQTDLLKDLVDAVDFTVARL